MRLLPSSVHSFWAVLLWELLPVVLRTREVLVATQETTRGTQVTHHFDSACWRIDVDEETGEPFWRGSGSGDKDESQFDHHEPLIMSPNHFPPETFVKVHEPEDDKGFYSKLFKLGENKTSPKDIVEWKRRCIEHFRLGSATQAQWDEMADKMLFASEGGYLDVENGLDVAIDPHYDEVGDA